MSQWNSFNGVPFDLNTLNLQINDFHFRRDAPKRDNSARSILSRLIGFNPAPHPQPSIKIESVAIKTSHAHHRMSREIQAI